MVCLEIYWILHPSFKVSQANRPHLPFHSRYVHRQYPIQDVGDVYVPHVCPSEQGPSQSQERDHGRFGRRSDGPDSGAVNGTAYHGGREFHRRPRSGDITREASTATEESGELLL